MIDDPNSDQALSERQRALDRVDSVSAGSKIDFIVEMCRGRDVLDLGCVGHAVRMNDPSWIHGQIREVARRLVGVDIDEEGVRTLTADGFEVWLHDVAEPPPPELAKAPFDVVVASEIIEHMSAPQHLLSFAAAVLKPDGLLVLTTPNPFAPSRIALGRRRLSRENIDHVVLMFPGGIVELAERCGLELVEAGTTALPSNWILVKRAFRSLELRLRRRDLPYWYLPPEHLVPILRERRVGWSGETAIYVLTKRRVN